MISPGRVNQGEVRPQGNQGMKGLGFSALRFDFKKKRRTFGNKKNHVCVQAAKKKKKKGTKE